MNKTRIDWMRGGYTWNPITGCKFGCPYCYAKIIAERFGKPAIGEIHEVECGSDVFPFGFDLTFYKNRLNEAFLLKKPSRIFVGSMSDIFGPWIPDRWIKAVFNALESAPWHTYYLLTKNPAGMKPYAARITNNIWIGTTVDTIKSVSRIKDLMAIPSGHRFISFEPLLEDAGSVVSDEYWKRIKWIIVGAQTGKQTSLIMPQPQWISAIDKKAYDFNIPIFMKSSIQKFYEDKIPKDIPLN